MMHTHTHTPTHTHTHTHSRSPCPSLVIMYTTMACTAREGCVVCVCVCVCGKRLTTRHPSQGRWDCREIQTLCHCSVAPPFSAAWHPGEGSLQSARFPSLCLDLLRRLATLKEDREQGVRRRKSGLAPSYAPHTHTQKKPTTTHHPQHTQQNNTHTHTQGHVLNSGRLTELGAHKSLSALARLW
jgi:hypothetical protein